MVSGGILPLLIIFGLDNTLYSEHSHDEYFFMPYSKTSNGTIVDKENKTIPLPLYYPDVPEILHKLMQKGIKTAITEPDSNVYVNYHVHLLDLQGFSISYRKMLSTYQISESLERLKNETNIDYSDMLYFGRSEDCMRDAEKLGITCFYMPDCGMTIDIFEIGIQLFQKLQPRRKAKEKPRRAYFH